MATASGFGGTTLAEVYVMRKLHKEKMKELMKKEAAAERGVAKEKKIKKSSGSFFGVFKKGHSAKVSSGEDLGS
ncbi:conserved hypothetical protein [Ricinus communis]|uniref:Uncharacterized protein n=1 Tax=Ricinus communis TaxID=3988 RepID=B9RJE2_RICCO|nr:conserved hypothetical protein [Ricinus communis]